MNFQYIFFKFVKKFQMKEFLSILISVCFISLFAQTGQELTKLKQEKRNIENQISILKAQLKDVDNKIYKLNSNPGTSTIIISSTSNGLISAKVSSGGAILRAKPESSGQIITTIKENETLYLYKDVQNLYIKAKYYGKDGWISYLNLKSSTEIEELMNKTNTSNKSQTKKSTTVIRNADTNSPKYKRLVKIYGKDKTLKLMNGEIWKGMSHGMVIESLGQPSEQKSVNSPKGLIETWKYQTKTVIFLNGSVDKWE